MTSKIPKINFILMIFLYISRKKRFRENFLFIKRFIIYRKNNNLKTILKMKIYCIFLIFFISVLIRNFNAFNCRLPFGCRLEKMYFKIQFEFNEKGSAKISTIICNVNSENFQFTFQMPLNFTDICNMNLDLYNVSEFYYYQTTVIRWVSKELGILDKQLNFKNVMHYFTYFEYYMILKISGYKGFDLNIFENNTKLKLRFYVRSIEFIDIRLEFYQNKKKITSCKEIIDFGPQNLNSIFQIVLYKSRYQHRLIHKLILTNVEYKSKICPLVLQNAGISRLDLVNLVDSFYKKNVLTFVNESFETLNSSIEEINLVNIQNVNLDLNLFNPSVFNNTKYIGIISGSLNSINEEIFIVLKNVYDIVLRPSILRKINHKQGIKWIKNLNYDVNVNLSFFNITESEQDTVGYKLLEITYSMNHQKRLSKYFPEEDFCIYIDFPFNQLVIFLDISIRKYKEKFGVNFIDTDHTCTYLWLLQYYEYYYKLFLYFQGNNSNDATAYQAVINSTAFQSISKCEFDRKISLCNKLNYQVRDIWDDSDFFILNKKLETAFKISLYPVAFLCMITNFLVILVILKKENKDLFKEYRQYSYLCLNSVFCILLSVIEILSWMTECFYPFKVFCPEIRKLAAIQFFKIIFKECFVTMFRFMCSFTYIAFALNRISLIGKDHGKLVTFMSEVGFKKYIGITLIISIIFSWIKFFKYEVNYLYPDAHYPLSNELDILSTESSPFNDFYFIYNSISDIVNYIIFVIICAVIDICMVVQLRKVLEEKTKKSESLNQKQNQTKKAENEEAVNKAIKMVVLNSAIGILFKLPVSFIPVINMAAQFYYKNLITLYMHPLFHNFYLTLYESGFYTLIQDLSALLFTFSLSIQMFIYKHFDKKFRTGFDRLKEVTINSIKNRFKRSS